MSERLSQPGVAIGLAWTPLGGEIMFVEASRMEGEGQLTLTGQLGDVMKESAHLAISWLRSNAKRYQLTNGRVGKKDSQCVAVMHRRDGVRPVATHCRDARKGSINIAWK